jgi:hypothetical protein
MLAIDSLGFPNEHIIAKSLIDQFSATRNEAASCPKNRSVHGRGFRQEWPDFL